MLNNRLLNQETFIDLELLVSKREQVKVTVDQAGKLITGQEVIAEEVKELIVDISN
ncbi:hypothetical protein [Sporohalobacter salinus]|uniref:hypothetical protein n=1 Tax=Sporohalobacter salinus TaxID=1494606 RepID=UPI001961B66E|nr:hypothetical protein [Sporohalobacter salinus]MBM7623910.1 hypothetical protein [Sporohalobacter salinus]